MTKVPRHIFDTVFVHPKPKALDVLPIIVFACADSLKGVCSVGAGNSILLIPRVCDLQVQISIYLSAGEREKMWRHSLPDKKVFAANLELIMLALELQERSVSLPVRLSASVFPVVDPGDTVCLPVSA